MRTLRAVVSAAILLAISAPLEAQQEVTWTMNFSAMGTNRAGIRMIDFVLVPHGWFEKFPGTQRVGFDVTRYFDRALPIPGHPGETSTAMSTSGFALCDTGNLDVNTEVYWDRRSPGAPATGVKEVVNHEMGPLAGKPNNDAGFKHAIDILCQREKAGPAINRDDKDFAATMLFNGMPVDQLKDDEEDWCVVFKC